MIEVCILDYLVIMDTTKDSKMAAIETFVFLKIGTFQGYKSILIESDGPIRPEVKKVCMLARTPKDIIQHRDLSCVRNTDLLIFGTYPISESDVYQIRRFLKNLLPPVCLVAHTGNKFHFILLNDELFDGAPGQSNVLQDIMFVDSQTLFDSMYPTEGGEEAHTLERRYKDLVKGAEDLSVYYAEHNCYKLQQIFNVAPEKTIAKCEEQKQTYEEMYKKWQKYVKEEMDYQNI